MSLLVPDNAVGEADWSAVLSDEIETTMRLMGVTDLDQLNEFYVNALPLEHELPHRISKL